MDDLLKKMIVQAKQEGRESLRQLVSAINGIAGIHILQGKVRLYIVLCIILIILVSRCSGCI